MTANLIFKQGTIRLTRKDGGIAAVGTVTFTNDGDETTNIAEAEDKAIVSVDGRKIGGGGSAYPGVPGVDPGEDVSFPIEVAVGGPHVVADRAPEVSLLVTFSMRHLDQDGDLRDQEFRLGTKTRLFVDAEVERELKIRP